MTDLRLDQVLADERGQAAVLRAKGHPHDAQLIEALCDRVQVAAEDYIRFISETDARLRSGWSVDRLKGKFPQWEREGHAERRGRDRYYRQLVIPQRVNPSAIRATARRDGESAA